MKLKLFFTILLFISSGCTTAEPYKSWNGKRAAIALTYDDALNVHLDTAVPALDTHGFKGTFYITVSSEPFSSRISDWRSIAKNGHELGNHTLFHPCTGGKGREWVSPENDLSTWTIERFVGNLKITNTMLEAVDGETKRTLAYTCGDTQVGPEKTSVLKEIEPLVSAARIVGGGPQTIKQLKSKLYSIHAHMVNNDSADKMIKQVELAIEQEALVVFLFHGVGGEHNLNVSSQAHSELLKYLSKKKADLWVAPLRDIVEFTQK